MFILTYILTFVIVSGALCSLIRYINKKQLSENNEYLLDDINKLKQQLSEEQQTKNKLIKSNNRLKKTIFKLKDSQRIKKKNNINN
jgi:hypothetical protein